MKDVYASRRGQARPAAKMTETGVRWMRWRREHERPRPTVAALAKQFGISAATAHAILTRRYWSHVE